MAVECGQSTTVPSRWWRRAWRSTTVKLGLGVLVAATIGASVAAALTQPSGAPNIPLLSIPIPRFDLPSVNLGRPGLSSTEMDGASAVVLNFWGSWCPPCRTEMPALQAAHRELGGKVIFVGIDEEDNRAAAISFIRRVGVTYPSGFDGNGAVAAAFNIDGTPTTYFISRGKELDFHEGALTKGALLSYVHQIFGSS